MVNGKNDKIKHWYIIISTVLLLCAVGWKGYCHFAKTKVVQDIAKTVVWVEERLSVGTHDDRVHRQEEAVNRARNRLRFEKKIGNPTNEELEDVRVNEKRLAEVIKEREELIEQYKSRK